jgi:hypothetical protein
VHLCLCAFTALFLGQDNWDWIFVATLNLPLIFLMDWFKLPIDRVTLTVAGTVWWLCIGIAISCISDWFARRRRMKALDAERGGFGQSGL